jgi:hypothetical protein
MRIGKIAGMQRTVMAVETYDGQTICATFGRCGMNPHCPLALPWQGCQ